MHFETNNPEAVHQVMREQQKLADSIPPEEKEFIERLIQLMALGYVRAPDDNVFRQQIDKIIEIFAGKGSLYREMLLDLIGYYKLHDKD